MQGWMKQMKGLQSADLLLAGQGVFAGRGFTAFALSSRIYYFSAWAAGHTVRRIEP